MLEMQSNRKSRKSSMVSKSRAFLRERPTNRKMGYSMSMANSNASVVVTMVVQCGRR